ncbi:MAG: DUF4276 family protein [Thermoanaerobaculia bacterium]|nr:DUF4276 family protein [Thermoanaerobaculia bacterium]
MQRIVGKDKTFVRDLLAPHLQRFEIGAVPVLISTKRLKSGGKFKGGISSYVKIALDLRELLRDSSATAVTTMVDYYGLPTDFPGKATLSAATSCYQRADQLEAAWRDDISDSRFIPYLSLHELEALLLTDPDQIARALNVSQAPRALRTAVAAKKSPEEINDGVNTHPAARITQALPSYRKALHGPLVASRIGLERMRENCPHFARWLSRLERLGES